MKAAQSIRQRQIQKQTLNLTPQLRQSLRLLQLSSLELEAEIEHTLESNIMLERDDDADTTPAPGETASPELSTGEETDATGLKLDGSDPDVDVPGDTDWSDPPDTWLPSSSAVPNEENGTEPYEYLEIHTGTLTEHLLQQIHLEAPNDTLQFVATTIIYSLDRDGFLTTPLEDIMAMLHGTNPTLTMEDLQHGLRLVQAMEPVGVAARDLRECLLLQLEQHPPSQPFLEEAITLVQDHMQLLAKRDSCTLQRRTRFKRARLEGAMRLIRSLDPRPGGRFNLRNTEYLSPDIRVWKNSRGQWQAELTRAHLPRLRINRHYRSMTKNLAEKTENAFLRTHLQEANWFLSALEKRANTVYRIATCIVTRQQEFFEHGLEFMKPMALQDIAQELDLHQSTISRASNGKYMETPHGIYELRRFFSGSLPTIGGSPCSSTAVQALIAKLIAEEDPKKPISDSQLVKLLNARGLYVARRTINKYRQTMSIPSSSERRQSF